MLAYILSNEDLTIKDVLNFEEYEFSTDIDFSNKSSIVVTRKPNVATNDFVWCSDDGTTAFVGICEDYSAEQDSNSYTITLLQKENLFDRQIFLTNESIKSGTGIEDFIANQIRTNWIASGDSMTDMAYMTATAVTHTPVSASVASNANVENGIYNLKTYIGNCQQYYRLYMDFVFNTVNDTLDVRISVKSDATLSLDATLSDIANYEETYEVNVLAKLNVAWTVSEGATPTYRTYYLRSDHTITTNVNDPLRVFGDCRAIAIQAETETDMVQQATNEFAGNRYNHKISFALRKESKLYSVSDYYVGRLVQFKTKSGIKSSIITAIRTSSDSGFLNMTFGKLKVTLVEKLRSIYNGT